MFHKKRDQTLTVKLSTFSTICFVSKRCIYLTLTCPPLRIIEDLCIGETIKFSLNSNVFSLFTEAVYFYNGVKDYIYTGHNQYDGKKSDRKNSKDKKEKSDAFFQIYLKFSLRIFYDYKHSIPWAIWTRNSNQYLSCILQFNRENE